MIPIRNIYHMLAYAFHVLRRKEYASFGSETFEHVTELYAAILAKGMASQIRKGLHRTYISKNEELTTPVGHIEFVQTFNPKQYLRRRIVCCHDDYSNNVLFNQIIKTTLIGLSSLVQSKAIKTEIRAILQHFTKIDTVSLQTVAWDCFVFNRNSQTYQMMMAICELAYKGLLQTSECGKHKLFNFEDEQNLWLLYQRFVFSYFKREYPQISVTAEKTNWILDDDNGDSLLPTMNPDITLKYGKYTLIIDTKFYSSHTVKNQFNDKKHRINNIYQMFAYVKNHSLAVNDTEHSVSGLLLYAGTKEKPLDSEYRMSGNIIGVKSLNLDCEFTKIRTQLNSIISRYFNIN